MAACWATAQITIEPTHTYNEKLQDALGKVVEHRDAMIKELTSVMEDGDLTDRVHFDK